MRNNVLLGAGILVLMVAEPAWPQPTGFNNHQVVKIQIADQTQLEVLRALDAASNDFEIWSEGLGVGVIEARVSPDQKRRLDASGLKYTVHIEDLQTHIDKMYADRAPGGFFDQYRTYDEHVTFLNDLVAQYPTLAQTVDLGLSVDGRTLLAIRITGPGASKVGVIYHGAQHGNEQAGAMLVAYTANHLLTHYATDPAVQTLVDNAEWFLLPIMNPDGYEAYSRLNANGVDLNRNWGGPGSGCDPWGDPYPFSEPETVALRDFLLAHPNVRLHLDVHGYVPWFMWPWGHKPEYTPDHSVYHSVGVEVRDLIDAAGGAYYEIGSIWEVAYPLSGGSVDYSYGDLNLWGYAFELTHSTIPDIYDQFLSSLLFLASWVSDCNDNGIPDFEEILAGSVPDCNDNGIPDECDIDYGTALDCNTNAVPDECDIADGTSEDCNLNEVPDECDLVGGTGFAAVRRYTAGGDPRSVAIGDLDNDGDADLAVANYYGWNVSVLLNNSDGTFAAAVSYSTGFLPTSVAIGDLDNDGDDDLAVAIRDTSDVSVLLNNGDGTFAATVSYPAGNGPLFVAIGDLDNDGDADLVVANGSGGNLSVLMNNGDGTFAAAVSYAAGWGLRSVAIGDLDNDGDADLAVAGSHASVLLNCGDGTFAAAVSYAAGEEPYSVAIGDLDKDGDADLAVANSHSDDASVLLNYGDGTFAAAVSYAAGEKPYSVAIGDLDNDGDADLAVANGYSSDVSVLLNNDDGTFAAAGPYAAGCVPLSVAIGDLDNDDDNDLAVANAASGDVTVLLNNVAAYSLDCNINDVPDECDVADGSSEDCTGNGIPDECEPDCNDNGVADSCDIADGTSEDCTGNGIPDECEPDCNDNGVADCCDIADGTSEDCNQNEVPDECDVADGTSEDCNLNGVPDECDLASGTSEDCNQNEVPDECDVADGTSQDCNLNGVLDECDIASGTSEDCNQNGVPDECDVVDGTSEDCNLNEVPDECDLVGGTGFELCGTYDAGNQPRSVAIGDLDDDGDDDVVVANVGSDDVSVLMNNGEGTFAPAVSYPAGDYPLSVAIGDLDDDGDEDLAVANGGSDDVSVLMNNGDGTFAAAVSYATGSGPRSVGIGDLDNDGDDDLAVANLISDNVSVLMNDGNGTFAAAVSYPAGDGPYSLAIGDLNNDGHDDLAVANYISDDVSVLMNNGDGTFALAVSYPTGNGPDCVATADLDNDGDDDLAVANLFSDHVSVLMNDGNGTFAAAVSYPVGDGPRCVAIGDLDNDGDDDLAAASSGSHDVSVLMNNAAGHSVDCNFNDIPDECDLADGTSDDCNLNGIPDECDLADGTSEDANDNGIPDECESPPVAICQDVTVEADTSCEGHVAAEDVDDGSYDLDGGPVDLSLEPPGPFSLGVTTVTLTVTDDLGQTDACVATVTVVDGPGTPPTITCPTDLTVECDESTEPPATGMATSADNCDSFPTIDYWDEVTPGSCPQEFVITRTWTATDAAGNSSSCDQVITVEDTTPPSIDIPASHLTVECDGAGNVAELNAWLDDHGGAVASDVCGGVTWSDDFTGLSDECGATGSATVTFTATDDCGLLSTTTATFTIEDSTPPTITCPTDVTVTCGEPTEPDAAGWATATDICDDDLVYPAIAYDDVETPTTCLADPIMYTIARTWMATDECGNFSECVQTITVMKMPLDLDIKPGSCPNSYNRNSHGVLPIGLLGTVDFDVTMVDLTSVRVSRADCVGGSVAPHEGPPGPHSVYSDVGTPFEGEWCDCHELEGDGFVDLSMKFKTDDVVPTLELDSLSPGALVELVVTGTLADGCEFIASDCVRLVPPGTAPGQLYVESTVPGAWIDASPLDETLDGGGFADFERVYPLTTVVTLTAEISSHGQSFVAWQIDGEMQEPGENTVQFVMDQSMTAKALYRAPVFWLPEQMGTERPLAGTEAP